MNYIKQLDSIRTFAVLLVILCHWGTKSLNDIFPFGNLGVNIFFVLSGFLITRILLIERENIQSKSKVVAIGNFMMRRSLRIFPIYYIMILILYFGAIYLPNPIPNDLRYYVLYLQNFLFYYRQAWPGGKVSPFWSLAVEEQFYLIWPWILFFINKKNIKKVMIIGIVIGTLSSIIFPLILKKNDMTPILTICCLHAFCFGGLLSYWSVGKDSMLENNYLLLKKLAIIAFISYSMIKISNFGIASFDRLFESVITTWVIASILLNKSSRFDFILNNKILISIGKVSYGIYLFHNFIPVSVNAILHFLRKINFEQSSLLQTINFFQNNQLIFNSLCLIILLMISYFSFYFIETPFLKLKKYFQ